ncbi:hypothetical protein LOZ80_04315 [Paenibacillus sp. HWE-109]|uniref:hypothetical protein n=1 Tax=Paenibacillus sp. HWE-109 TaxID=1306526 RepID=UPI001EDDA31C|nr:hypothetical protein [Paenibacillus sp. HWE-109]UKS28165.1 hypothetical protein LOZ80_04315 [Paenibacillus sp. HWE-109]
MKAKALEQQIENSQPRVKHKYRDVAIQKSLLPLLYSRPSCSRIAPASRWIGMLFRWASSKEINIPATKAAAVTDHVMFRMVLALSKRVLFGICQTSSYVFRHLVGPMSLKK